MDTFKEKCQMLYELYKGEKINFANFSTLYWNTSIVVCVLQRDLVFLLVILRQALHTTFEICGL